MNTAEHHRLDEDRERRANWKRWGPYLSERQWGTVREDYSADGSSWDYVSHDDARRRAYRWGEDGLQGWCDRQCRLCFSLALWNENDGILKERLFGLTGPEGNHGEDVKEAYYYLESTPTHSYTKALYKYPHAAYPYAELKSENAKLGRLKRELEIEDFGVFQNGAYFDVQQEVAKRSPEDILWKITVTNHGKNAAPIHLLPTVWFRNTWRWGRELDDIVEPPKIMLEGDHLALDHSALGRYEFHALVEGQKSATKWLFTDNESDNATLFGTLNHGKYQKDAFHKSIVDGKPRATNPKKEGTKASPHFRVRVPAGGTVTVRCRLHSKREQNGLRGLDGYEETMGQAIAECDDFYNALTPDGATETETRIFRQGYAGLLWTKQYYNYEIEPWLEGDPCNPEPPESRAKGRNSDWGHLHARDILSMPDKWEYPWFAAWDTAFHMIPFATIDPVFAKDQLLLFLREWYMHPNGQIPAYEWNFSDVNPPVHAWAVWRVYKIADEKGERDLDFLERAFQKLMLNFTWWVNRKDVDGRHVFGGGFLGLDNIGVFDRSRELPGGGHLNQADGTGWMAFYSLTMLSIALELATERPPYEDIASKFFEHFVSISEAMNTIHGAGLWNEDDGFYYDQLIIDKQRPIPLKIRSLVGLLPMIATTVLKESVIQKLPGFRKRMDWFLAHKPDVLRRVQFDRAPGRKNSGRVLLAVPTEEQLRATLTRMLDEAEFLSPYGIRSLSKAHADEPFIFEHHGETHEVSYTPGESVTGMFGGNSNWRGPIWFPTNFLLIEALERYDYFYGDNFKIEYPTGSGVEKPLREIAIDICSRLISIFEPDDEGKLPCLGESFPHHGEASWENLILFHEYFHGDTGQGLGASHQTGWTALVVRLIRERRNKLLRMCEEEN